VLLRLADRIWLLPCRFVELFKYVEQLNAVLLLFLLFQIDLVILVETFLTLPRVLELALWVLPRLLRLKIFRVDFPWLTFCVAH